MIQDRTPQFIIWSLATTALCIVSYSLARYTFGFAPELAAMICLVPQCAIMAGSLLAALGKRPLVKNAPRLAEENDFPAGPTAGLLPLIASAGIATPLCWTVFKLTASGTFFLAGVLIMMGVILFSLMKDIDEQVKFGAIIACMLIQVTLVMVILT